MLSATAPCRARPPVLLVRDENLCRLAQGGGHALDAVTPLLSLCEDAFVACVEVGVSVAAVFDPGPLVFLG